MLKRVMAKVKDVSDEQRGRIKEAVQEALQDGSLQVLGLWRSARVQ